MDTKQLSAQFLKFRSEKKKEKPVAMKEKKACEQCGEEKGLSSHYGLLVCSTCTIVRGQIKSRPQSAIVALREFHGGLVQFLTAQEIASVIGQNSAEVKFAKKESNEDLQQHAADLKEALEAITALKVENARLAKDNMTLHLEAIEKDKRIDILDTQIEGFDTEMVGLSRDNENLKVAIGELKIVVGELKGKPSHSLDKAKLASLLAEIGQGIVDGKKQLSGRIFRELRKLAA